MSSLYIPHEGPVLSRAEAVKRGQRLYFTGRPCLRGHVSLRRVVSISCCQCDREKLLKRRPLTPKIPASSSIDAMFSMVSPEPNSGCWLWTGNLSDNGYGVVEVRDRRRRAHRVAYELVHGPIPSGLEPDHLCRVRCCINPAHLEPVTRQLNTLRGLRGKDRQAKILTEFVSDLVRSGYPLPAPLAVGPGF